MLIKEYYKELLIKNGSFMQNWDQQILIWQIITGILGSVVPTVLGLVGYKQKSGDVYISSLRQH